MRLYILDSAGPQIFTDLLSCDGNRFKNPRVPMGVCPLMVRDTLNCSIEDITLATLISAGQCYSVNGN